MRKRLAEIMSGATTFDLSDNENIDYSDLDKCWLGAFVNWLKKMATVESSNVGYLS